MSASITPSQTVGPFFGVGLPFEKGEQMAPAGSAGSIRIEGQVLDGHGDPVPDALLEVWQPDARGQYPTAANGEPIGASGLRQVYEVVAQLRGGAGDRQVPGEPRVGFTHVYGAPGISACTVLTR